MVNQSGQPFVLSVKSLTPDPSGELTKSNFSLNNVAEFKIQFLLLEAITALFLYGFGWYNCPLTLYMTSWWMHPDSCDSDGSNISPPQVSSVIGFLVHLPGFHFSRLKIPRIFSVFYIVYDKLQSFFLRRQTWQIPIYGFNHFLFIQTFSGVFLYD